MVIERGTNENLAVEADWEPSQLIFKEVSTHKQKSVCFSQQRKVYPASGSMKVLVLCVCLSVGCLAQRPRQCSKSNTDVQVNCTSSVFCVVVVFQQDALNLRSSLTTV